MESSDLAHWFTVTVCLLYECMMIRDRVFNLPDVFTVTDIENIITHLCRD